MRRDERVGVKNNEIIADSLLEPIISGEALPGIFLKKILDVELIGKLRHYPIGLVFRAVFYYDHLKIRVRLFRQTTQQFTEFVGAVEDGDDDGEIKHFRQDYRMNR